MTSERNFFFFFIGLLLLLLIYQLATWHSITPTLYNCYYYIILQLYTHIYTIYNIYNIKYIQ